MKEVQRKNNNTKKSLNPHSCVGLNVVCYRVVLIRSVKQGNAN